MLHKTESIVLHTLKYGESSLIVRAYTEALGARSYLINQVRSAKSKHKAALFQPLTLLDMVVYDKRPDQLNRISELRCLQSYETIPYDITKSAIALFLSEVLSRVLREEEAHEPLFAFLKSSFTIFDHLQVNYHSFHLQFLLKLTAFLGFSPGFSQVFFEQIETAAGQANQADHELWQWLKTRAYEDPPAISAAARQQFLDKILLYYRQHVEPWPEIKSIAVLKAVFQS